MPPQFEVIRAIMLDDSPRVAVARTAEPATEKSDRCVTMRQGYESVSHIAIRAMLWDVGYGKRLPGG